MSKLSAGKRVPRVDVLRVDKYRRKLTLATSIVPIKDRNGNVSGFGEIMRNISSQREQEAALTAAETQVSIHVFLLD